MKIYNTLSGKKEKMTGRKGKSLRLFVCGPTVYDDAHLGHARTYLFFDLFARYLRARGSRLFYLQNITNIDDKIIDRARKESKNPLALANFFEQRYRADMKRLRVVSVNRYARATEFIPEIVRQVQTLTKKSYAYETKDGWYFDIKKFKSYGKLSKRTALQADDSVSRIDESVKKRNKGDFVLWKFSKPNEPSWNTVLGKGRPGWHIEDTAISEKFFGPQYELHGGGIDLKFPHHEAEIAEQEAASGKVPFVKIWMHTGLLTVRGEKMAKSLKNFITIRDFLKSRPPEILRFVVLKHHYRSPLNYSEEVAGQAEADLRTIKDFLVKLALVSKKGGPQPSLTLGLLKRTEEEFHGAMENDFNTPEALAAFFKMMNLLQAKIWKMSRVEAKKTAAFISLAFKTLGLEFKPDKIPAAVSKILKRRELLRHHKQFKQADALRKKIRVLGYELEDTPLGPLVLRK